MVLAADVRAPNGRLLLRTGTALTRAHLSTLRSWGVTDAQVAGAAEPAPQSPPDPAAWAAAEIELAERFRFTDMAAAPISELFRLGVLHRLGRLDTPDAS